MKSDILVVLGLFILKPLCSVLENVRLSPSSGSIKKHTLVDSKRTSLRFSFCHYEIALKFLNIKNPFKQDSLLGNLCC